MPGPFCIPRSTLRRSARRAISTLLAAAILAGLCAGCGGNGDTSSTSLSSSLRGVTTVLTTSMSKSRFVARANAACRQAWPEIRDNYLDYRRDQDAALSARQRFADLAQNSLMNALNFHMFDGIQMLGAPSDQGPQVEAIIGPLELSIRRGEQRPLAYSIPEVVELFAVFNRRALAYGLQDCLIDRFHLRRLGA